MPYTLYQIVNFGSGKTGIATVGYQLFDSTGAPVGTRQTAGVQELGGGQYGSLVTFADDFVGRITWDTGEPTPVYASAPVNPEEADDVGVGEVPVDHNYGGPRNLAYETSDGFAVGGADVQVYLKADYDAGSRHAVAQTTTLANGAWAKILMLAPGVYTLIYSKGGYYGPDRVDVTVVE